MNEESKKIEQIGHDATESSLSEQDLGKVAGGGTSVVNSSRSNIKNNLDAPPPPPVGTPPTNVY